MKPPEIICNGQRLSCHCSVCRSQINKLIVMSEFENKSVTKKTGDASEDVNLVEVITSGNNPRGIPSAVFIVS